MRTFIYGEPVTESDQAIMRKFGWVERAVFDQGQVTLVLKTEGQPYPVNNVYASGSGPDGWIINGRPATMGVEVE